MDLFELDLLRQYWVNEDPDNQTDYCSHGEIFLKIGQIEILNKENGSWTVASAALRLLKSSLFGYDGENDLPIIACCGYLLSAGCPNYVTWNAKIKSDIILISRLEYSENSSNGQKVFDKEFNIGLKNYSKQILSFARRVKRFYHESKPRTFEFKYEMEEFDSYWDQFEKLYNMVDVQIKRLEASNFR